jgi:hypothetical protein
MSKIYAAMLVCATTLTPMTGAVAQTADRQRAGYCLLHSQGGSDCSFSSKAQCEEMAFGQGAECYRDASIGYHGEIY